MGKAQAPACAPAGKVLTPLTRDQNQLAERYVWLARDVAKRFGRHPEAEEIEGVAYEALVDAAGSYDSSKRIAFATWVLIKVYSRISHHLAAAKLREERFAPLDSVPEPGRDGDPADGLVLAEALEAADRWCDGLKPDEAVAVRRVVIGGESPAAVAAELGCCVSTVHDRRRRGLSAIRDRLEREGDG
jgi:RNA polymerase sigma factor (sigma-70 family)